MRLIQERLETGPRPAPARARAGGSLKFPPYTGHLSVVVPVKDESGNIEPLLREIHAALADVPDFEVVYVDDGSTDETPQVLAQAAEQYPRLRVLRHDRCCGQSTALATGVREARHPWVATLDGDLQNDPADIPRLLQALGRPGGEAGPALVVGWRTARHDSVVRKLSSRIANAVRGYLLGDHTPDTGCGLKVFSRDVFLRVPFFDHMHRFLPALFLREGVEIASVPVTHRPRVTGTSKYGIGNRLWVGIVDLFGVMWLERRMTRPRVER